MLISDFISRSVAERFKALIKSRRLLSGPGSKLGGNHNGPLPPPPSFLSFFSFPPLKINEILLFLLQGSECSCSGKVGLTIKCGPLVISQGVQGREVYIHYTYNFT